VLQIGAAIIERNSLEIIDKFNSLLKPEDFSTLEEEALQVNHLKVEDLEKAPDTKIVWEQFTNWVNKYNIHKNKSNYGACIAAGYNINNFDLIIADRYCEKYGPWDEKRGQQKLFSQIHKYDVFDLMDFFNESNSELKSMSLGSVMEYMGVDEEVRKGAHDALFDVLATSAILIKLLKAQRYLTARNSEGNRRLTMKGALAGWKP